MTSHILNGPPSHQNKKIKKGFTKLKSRYKKPQLKHEKLTTCISPFSPGRGGQGFGRELFSLRQGEHWSKVSTI